MVVDFEVSAKSKLKRIMLGLALSTSTGIPVLHFVDRDYDFALGELYSAKTIRVTIPKVQLYPGQYSLTLWAGSPMLEDSYDYVVDCLSIEILAGSSVKRCAGSTWTEALVAHSCSWQTP